MGLGLVAWGWDLRAACELCMSLVSTQHTTDCMGLEFGSGISEQPVGCASAKSHAQPTCCAWVWGLDLRAACELCMSLIHHNIPQAVHRFWVWGGGGISELPVIVHELCLTTT